MTRTITLYNLIKQEFLKVFNTDLLDKHRNQILFYERKQRILTRLIKYDKNDLDIIEICHITIFYGLGDYLDEITRHKFEKIFINRFLNRRFAYQTYELVSAKLSSIVAEKADIIKAVFNENFLLGEFNNNTQTDSSGTNKSNNLNTTLPQDNVNMDLSMETMPYADTNTITKQGFEQESKTTGNTTKKSLDEVDKLNTILNKIFLEIDKALFTQII